MRETSVYSVECVCGHHIESESRSLVCPTCKRHVVIDWPASIELTADPKTVSLRRAA